MVAIPCPHCGNAQDVIKHGVNRSGSPRCRGCGRTFTPRPHSRAMTDQKRQQILRALQERVSQRGIARALRVGRQTVRAVRKGGPR